MPCCPKSIHLPHSGAKNRERQVNRWHLYKLRLTQQVEIENKSLEESKSKNE